MWTSKASFRFKVTALILAVVLLVPVLIACGDDNEDDISPIVTTTATITPTSTTTQTATPTPTPTPGEPIKIGIVLSWSGPMALAGLLMDPVISLVEDQVKSQGGILGGREIKFVKGDDGGTVAGAAAAALKLVKQDNVVALAFGGVSAASFAAVSDVAEQYKVPFITVAPVPDMATRKYTANLVSWESSIGSPASHIIEFFKPKTVAFLWYDVSDCHLTMDGTEGVKGLRQRVKDAGIDIVQEQYYPVDTVDFSPYLTKMKYANPDLLAVNFNNPGTGLTILKQMMGLGGLGTMKWYWATGVPETTIKRPDAVGTYGSIRWIPGSQEPGMKAFEDAFVQKYGKVPSLGAGSGYSCFMTAVKAIELAGSTSPDAIAKALRSGNLQWDSAFGPMSIDSEGNGTVVFPLGQLVEVGKVVQVWP